MAIILIPGIKGSELTDSYPLDWPVRWSIGDMVFGDAGDNPLDFALIEGRYENNDAHLMLPSRPIRFAYGEMVGKLRAWHAPELVYVFTYDWRRPLEHAATRLAEFCSAIEGRLTALGRREALNFVSHSMGGLVLSAALGLRNAQDPFAGVERVVFIAPPFRGTVAAPQMLVAGEKDGLFGTDEDYRKIARTFPSVYQMTPRFDGCCVAEDDSPVDLLDPHNWQANVRDGKGGFQAGFVTAADAFLRARSVAGVRSAAPLLPDAAVAAQPDKVLILQSTGIDTVRQLRVQTQNPHNPNWFDFAAATKDKLGDGRVHLRSSAIAGLTLASFAGGTDHGRACRDSRIINTVSLWLDGKRALKLAPRSPEHSAEHRGGSYFEAWDGDVSNFARHVV